MAAPLKDGLGRAAVARLARNIRAAWPGFDDRRFVSAALKGIADLELKQRVSHVAGVLAELLPPDYPDALQVVVHAGEVWEPGDASDPLDGFAAWPLFRFIEDRGTGDFVRSMAALRSITHLFTAEFAVRPFLERYPKRAFRELARWTSDPSEHVRRLVSESTRPRLPWAPRIPALVDDPTPVLALLERLKDDPALYVRRSVANSLNDISKDHPDRVVEVCRAWARDRTAARKWILGHATRTLVKKGHPGVWGLLGVTQRPRLARASVALGSDRVRVGEDLTFAVEIASAARGKQRLVVDYAVHFVKSNGKRAPKVFKLRVVELEPREVLRVTKRHSFRRISTRKYYPGPHAIELLVNGVSRASAEFELR